VGILSAISFAAELVASIAGAGFRCDVAALVDDSWCCSRSCGPALVFGLTHSTSIFFASRTLEGLSAAAVIPALLAYLTVETEGDSKLRIRHELL